MTLLNANKSFHGFGSIEDCAALLGIQETLPEAEFQRRLSPQNPSVVVPYGREIEKNGAVYVLAKAGAAISKGHCVGPASGEASAATLSGLHSVDVAVGAVTDATIDNNYLEVTIPALPAAGALNEFAGGHIVIYAGTGIGDMYMIRGNEAWTSAAETGVRFYVSPNILTSKSTDTGALITKNPYANTMKAEAAGVGMHMGGCMGAATTTNNVYWICRQGLGPGRLEGTITRDLAKVQMTVSGSVAGEIEQKATLNEVVATLPRYTNGTAQFNIADNEVSFVIWTCENIS